MAFNGEYACTSCGSMESREDLLAKRAQYQTLGREPKTLRSRVVAWLCPSCIAKDPDYNVDSYSSPGMLTTQRKRQPMRFVREDVEK